MTTSRLSRLRVPSIVWFGDPAAADPGRVGAKAAALARLPGRYAGAVVSAGLLAALLGHGTQDAAAFFAITCAAACAAAVLALRLGPPRDPAVAAEPV